MNKKILYAFIVMLMIIPITVYAADGEADPGADSMKASAVCIHRVRYSVYPMVDNGTNVFDYASVIDESDFGKYGFFIQNGLRFGQKYTGGPVITPDFYISGLKKIRDEFKEAYKDEKYNLYCVEPKDEENAEGTNDNRGYGRNNNNNNKISNETLYKCKMSTMTDSDLLDLAINLANSDDEAVKKQFDNNPVVNTWTFKANYRNYFKYTDEQTKKYSFIYSVDYSNMYCKAEKRDKKYSRNGDGWKTGAWGFKACPVADEVNKNVSYDTGNVDVTWDYANSQWEISINGLKGVGIKFVKKDYYYNSNCPVSDDKKMDFLHLVDPCNTELDSYDFNDYYCSVSKVGNTCNGASDLDWSRYRNSRIVDSGDGSYSVKFNADRMVDVFYIGAYYVNKGDQECNGADLYWHQISTGDSVPNPYIDDTKGKAVCNTYVGEMAKYGYSEAFAKLIVSECNENTQFASIDRIQGIYNNGKFDGYSQVKADMDAAIAKYSEQAKSLKTGVVTSEGNTVCEFNYDEETGLRKVQDENTVTYSYRSLLYNDNSRKYWNAMCTERITLKFLGPRALDSAGEGFTYPVEVVQTRECEPIKISEPQPMPLCSYGMECWGGPPGHTGEGGAGPNEDFEKCINSCDGGLYSQSCINKCYTETYVDADMVLAASRDRSLLTPVAGTSKMKSCEIGKVKEFAKGRGWNIGGNTYYHTKRPISSCLIISGNLTAGNVGRCTNTKCTSEHGITFTYLDGCNGYGAGDGTACYEVFTSTPQCLERFLSKGKWRMPENAEARAYCEETDMSCYQHASYAIEVVKAEEEYREIVEDISKFNENDDPTTQANYFTVTLNNEDNPMSFIFNESQNVMYKKYINGGQNAPSGFTAAYDTNSQNIKTRELTEKYYKQSPIVRTTNYSEFYNRLDPKYTETVYSKLTGEYAQQFYNDYKDDYKREHVNSYTIERKYVFNLPDVEVNNAYTSFSNYVYYNDKNPKLGAYKYVSQVESKLSNDSKAEYKNMFITMSPDNDGINYLKLIYDPIDNKKWEHSWNLYDNVASLKKEADSVKQDQSLDINWENIRLTYSLGTWNQVSSSYKQDNNPYSDITCFYGIPPCTSPMCPPDTPEGDTPGGVSYIFRPIELSNVFPCNGGDCGVSGERDPRYNWSEEAKTDFDNSLISKVTNYDVDPIKVKEDIEKANQSIYDVTNTDSYVDYDIEITQKQIKNIRNLNSKLNYGDYSTMECVYDKNTKMNVCRSTFLSDSNNVTIIEGRRGILGCNNQKSKGQCE